jgi:hypothetical protein
MPNAAKTPRTWLPMALWTAGILAALEDPDPVVRSEAAEALKHKLRRPTPVRRFAPEDAPAP